MRKEPVIQHVQRIGAYVLGGMVGFVFGILVEPYVASALGQHAWLVEAAFVLIGLLTTNSVLQARAIMAARDEGRMRDQTVAITAHEMRTSLTGASWQIGLILRDYAKAISPEDVEMLQRTIQGIQMTVMHSVNLLDASLLEMGKLTLSLEWMTLGDVEVLMTDTVKKFTHGAAEKGVLLVDEITLDPTMRIQVDALRLRVILENLLENALQYTTLARKEIHVRVTNDATMLHMTVTDTGIGIPVFERDKIFTQFFRATNAHKALSSGSGIGLYLCREYALAHGGSIRFETEENKGTTFVVDIPLKTAAKIDEFFVKM